MKGRRLLLAAISSGSLLFLSSCYTVNQALYFNHLFNSREKIAAVLAEQRYSAPLRQKLESIEAVLLFAKQQGLNVEDAYQYYIHTAKDDVSYTVSAADPLSFTYKKWWFPIVGSVPYLGFFDSADRDEKAEDLAAEYDIHKATVGAFSSLGWFEDPIYTPMLRRSESSLANLLFHELTHRSFWARGSVRFNENLAEFIAHQLTLRYFAAEAKADERAKYLKNLEDLALLKAWIKKLKKALSAVYRADGLSDLEKLQAKRRTIDRFQLEEMPEFHNKLYRSVVKKPWNNASILGAGLYSPDLQRFEKAYQCSGATTPGEFLEKFRAVEDQDKSEFAVLDALCQGTQPAIERGADVD